MRKSGYIALTLLAVLSLTAGCYTKRTGKSKSRYHETPGSYTDQAARNEYIEKRADELMRRGLKREDAITQASSDWFSQAPVASETPTRDELERRAAQADFADYYRNSKKNPGDR